MIMNKKQLRIKKKLYKSAKGNKGQTEAMDAIFDILGKCTQREVHALLSDVEKDIEIEEIYNLKTSKEKAIDSLKAVGFHIVECTNCDTYIMIPKIMPMPTCNKCGSNYIIAKGNIDPKKVILPDIEEE